MANRLYAQLHLAPYATAPEIRAAYLRLASRYHPDRNPGNADAAERFRQLQFAYDTLADPVSRAAYDRDPEAFSSRHLIRKTYEAPHHGTPHGGKRSGPRRTGPAVRLKRPPAIHPWSRTVTAGLVLGMALLLAIGLQWMQKGNGAGRSVASSTPAGSASRRGENSKPIVSTLSPSSEPAFSASRRVLGEATAQLIGEDHSVEAIEAAVTRVSRTTPPAAQEDAGRNDSASWLPDSISNVSSQDVLGSFVAVDLASIDLNAPQVFPNDTSGAHQPKLERQLDALERGRALDDGSTLLTSLDRLLVWHSQFEERCRQAQLSSLISTELDLADLEATSSGLDASPVRDGVNLLVDGDLAGYTTGKPPVRAAVFERPLPPVDTTQTHEPELGIPRLKPASSRRRNQPRPRSSLDVLDW